MYFPAIREVCDRLKLRLTYFGAGGTSPLFVENREDLRGYGEWRVDDRIEFDKDRIRFLEKNSPRVIFVCARWTLYSMDFYNWTPQRLKTHLEYLRAVCGDALMVFLGQPPEILLTGDVVAAGRVIEPPLRVFRETAIATKQRREVHDEIRRFCLQNKNCYFIDTESAFLRDGRPILLDEGECLYIDSDHLSVEGALRVVPLVVEQLVPRLLQDVTPVSRE
jgi:hypothetical protein